MATWDRCHLASGTHSGKVGMGKGAMGDGNMNNFLVKGDSPVEGVGC